MSGISPWLLGLSLSVACASISPAQEMAPSNASMPKVLQITREYIKPGKSGAVHDKSESAFVQAMSRARFPTHYFAVNSLSGKSRALYLTGYASYAAWEKDNKAIDMNRTLSGELDRASMADGELLDSIDQAIFNYDDEVSFRPHADLSHARYLEITVFHVRLGHGKDWKALAKMVEDAHVKAGTAAHWAAYEIAYGDNDGTWILLSADDSMADIDASFVDDKKFHEAMGEEGMKKLHELYGATVASSNSELFSINPRQSYPPEEWVKGDPAFWKPKPAMAAMAKPAAKPTEEKAAKP
jgi:hypothetical protein